MQTSLHLPYLYSPDQAASTRHWPADTTRIAIPYTLCDFLFLLWSRVRVCASAFVALARSVRGVHVNVQHAYVYSHTLHMRETQVNQAAASNARGSRAVCAHGGSVAFYFSARRLRICSRASRHVRTREQALHCAVAAAAAHARSIPLVVRWCASRLARDGHRCETCRPSQAHLTLMSARTGCGVSVQSVSCTFSRDFKSR